MFRKRYEAIKQAWQRWLDGPVAPRRRPELPDPHRLRPWQDPHSHDGERDPLAQLSTQTLRLPAVRQPDGTATATVVLRGLRAATAQTEIIPGLSAVQQLLNGWDDAFLAHLTERARIRDENPDWALTRYLRRHERDVRDAARRGDALDAEGAPETEAEWIARVQREKQIILNRARRASDPDSDDTDVFARPTEMSYA